MDSILILLYLFGFQNAMEKFSFRCVTIVTASLFRLKNLFLLKLEGVYFYRFLLFMINFISCWDLLLKIENCDAISSAKQLITSWTDRKVNTDSKDI